VDELLFKHEVFQTIGAAIEVHRELGPGFLEAVYQEALERELTEREIPFQSQVPLRVRYKGCYLKKHYMADFVVFGQCLLEIKALDCLTDRETSQLLNYLRATGFPLGLIINFGSGGKLEWKRLAMTHSLRGPSPLPLAALRGEE